MESKRTLTVDTDIETDTDADAKADFPSETPAPYIFLAMPCYSGLLHVDCFKSVLRLSHLCLEQGIRLYIATDGAETLIPRARNFFVARFLSQPEYTHLLFIDSDISFDPESVMHMVRGNKPVVGGCYPKKNLNLHTFRELATSAENKDAPLEILTSKSLSYAVRFDAHKKVDVKDGFMPVEAVATGFMLIARATFERLREVFPEKRYFDDDKGHGEKVAQHFYTFFECTIDPETHRFMSEDYSFCHLCQKIGIPIWADLTARLTHTGTFVYQGAFAATLDVKPKSPASTQAKA